MNEWVEERAGGVRAALGIEGFPGEADLYRLVDWLGDIVVLRHAPVVVASCLHRADRRAIITLPEDLSGRRLDLELCHELGHALLTLGVGTLLRQMAPGDYRILRLASRWQAQDEARAQAFILAWYLPPHLVPRYDDLELAELSRCTLEMVRRRREGLRGRIPELTVPPRWAACRQYRVVLPSRSAPLLSVVAREGGCPAFLFPGLDARQVEELAVRLSMDLLALTAPEFEIKYARYRPLVRQR